MLDHIKLTVLSLLLGSACAVPAYAAPVINAAATWQTAALQREASGSNSSAVSKPAVNAVTSLENALLNQTNQAQAASSCTSSVQYAAQSYASTPTVNAVTSLENAALNAAQVQTGASLSSENMVTYAQTGSVGIYTIDNTANGTVISGGFGILLQNAPTGTSADFS